MYRAYKASLAADLLEEILHDSEYSAAVLFPKVTKAVHDLL